MALNQNCSLDHFADRVTPHHKPWMLAKFFFSCSNLTTANPKKLQTKNPTYSALFVFLHQTSRPRLRQDMWTTLFSITLVISVALSFAAIIMDTIKGRQFPSLIFFAGEANDLGGLRVC